MIKWLMIRFRPQPEQTPECQSQLCSLHVPQVGRNHTFGPITSNTHFAGRKYDWKLFRLLSSQQPHQLQREAQETILLEQ